TWRSATEKRNRNPSRPTLPGFGAMSVPSGFPRIFGNPHERDAQLIGSVHKSRAIEGRSRSAPVFFNRRPPVKRRVVTDRRMPVSNWRHYRVDTHIAM